MLINLSEQLRLSKRKRHLLYLFLTTCTILLIGYQFGTFDEAMHIPFLKDLANPALYPGDKMMDLHSIYYSYFWYFFIPFYNIGLLEPALFIVHLFTIYLSFWAIWDLSDTIFHDPLTSLISTIAIVMPHFSFVGFPIFEFAPLSRTFVLPFLLIAMNQFLKGRIILAFFIAGLMYNLHVVSVNFILVMFGLACLLEFNRIGVKKIILSGIVFLAAALPVLAWKAGQDPIDFSLRPEWVAFLNLTLFRHIFAMVGTYPATWLIVLSGLCALGLFFIADKVTAPVSTSRTIRIFIWAGIIVMSVNVITVNWLPVTIIIQSQIARVGLWTLILAYIYFANLLSKLYKENNIPRNSYWFLFSTYILSPLPIIPFCIWFFTKYIQNNKIIKTIQLITVAAIAVCIVTFLYLGFWHPGIYIYGENTPWIDVQRWARGNTTIDSKFITPPEKWGVQEPDWRVHSERGSAGTLSELLVAAFQPGYEIEWKQRFNLLAPGALEKFNGDYFWNVDSTRKAYQSLTEQQLKYAACELKSQYIVHEKPVNMKMPVAYENSSFIVYNVKDIPCNN